MWNAVCMALTVIAWAIAIGVAGGIILILVAVTLEIYKEYFHKR